MAHTFEYDVLVVGAGIAGMGAAVTANALGKRVAVAEKRRVGGNCTNFTCIPSKALIRLAHLNRDSAHLDYSGLSVIPSRGLDGRKAMEHIRSIVQTAYEKDLPDTFEEIGIRVLSGAASFLDRHRVRVGEREISAEKIIVASGTAPVIPAIDGLSDVDFLTNETLYRLEDFPKSLIILGGGTDGFEYASAFARLGVETTVVEMADRLLPLVDREIANHLLRTLSEEGVRLLPGSKAVNVRKEQDEVVLTVQQKNGELGTVRAERVLVAIGRKPDLEGLCLENAGVNYQPRGILADRTLRTSAPNIYVCGDIVGPYQLASTAEYQGIVAANNALLPFKQRVDYRNNVYVIFTDPPIAYLGLTEAQAHARYGHKLKVYRFEYATMRRALIDGTQTGMAKFLCDGRGRIVGAHILGEGAPEVIHEVQVIKALNKPLRKLQSVTHAYPTYAQALVGRASQLAFLDSMAGSVFVRLGLWLLPGFENKLQLARDRLAEQHHHSGDNGGTARIEAVEQSGVTLSKRLSLNAAQCGSTACIIQLPKDVIAANEEPALWLASQGGLQPPAVLILDFSRVETMNGLGAAMLAKLSLRTKNARQRILAFGVTDTLGKVLSVTELDRVIGIHSSAASALSAAGATMGQVAPESLSDTGVFADRRFWADPVSEMMVPVMPAEARNLNVDGRRPVGPLNGFGPLWQKAFRLHVRDPEITQEQCVAALKANFPAFQPWFNRFFASDSGIAPGEIVLIDSLTPGGPVSTGVMVMYADERSFTFLTPQGHPECGWVTLSARRESEKTVVEVLGLARASDPVYEVAFRLLGSKIQNRIWTHVLTALAVHLGIPADITMDRTCVDCRLQPGDIRNVWYNAQIRTLVHEPGRLVRSLRRWF